MKFKPNTRRRALEYEKDWVQRWKADKTFEKSVEQRSKDNSYVFYDGPPFISGVPHHGTLLSSIVKDAVPRYWTMKGKRVERVWGWDCHGLPAERYTEKKLGLKSREEVIDYGIEQYIVACRDNMVQTSSEWESTIDRIGRWVDFKGAYKTMDKNYMESVWWAFKELYDKGKIYEGEKVLMYCTLDATPLSKAEVTMDAGAYQDVTDPSVYVKFRLRPDAQHEAQGTQPVYLLAWTTTPWTLPANTALAINEKLTYVEIEIQLPHNSPKSLPAGQSYRQERWVVAKELVGKVMQDEKHQPLAHEILREFKGKELVGREYEPLFVDRGEGAHKVWAAPYVSHEDGTGIVHLAPAYGEEDFALAKEYGIPVVHTIDENGVFTEGPWQGANVWEINKTIAKDMHRISASDEMQDSTEQRNVASKSDGEVSSGAANAAVRRETRQVSSSGTEQVEPWRGSVWKIEYIRHSYPHCHRCGTKLMYRAHPSWFMDIAGQREKMLEKNEPINWFPSHVKNGRFEKTVLQAPDWNISRDRFWATAMPVWKSPSGKIKVVGSYAELKELSGKELADYHRPWVDDITFEIDGEVYTRTDKVMDSWFEAGSMPFAQFHYPFENKAKFEANFPGDFIVEYIGQVRAWFYYMHAMSVALFGENSFKNVIVTGNVAGNDGRKMSKSYGNYTDPNELMDKFSADSLRFLLLSSPLLSGEDFALQDKEVGDVARKLSMVWNMYDFFTLYAAADDWEYTAQKITDQKENPFSEEAVSGVQNPLDVWIVSRLHQLVAEVEKHMDGYNLPDAMSPILPFIDDASNWYVRRSRRRFWKSEDDVDKHDAYRTLHYVLVRLAYVLAPFTPFLAEELYHNLTGDTESIHLKDWLPAGHINELTVKKMERSRELINAGLSLRMKKDEHQDSIKVRQPLPWAAYAGEKLDDYYEHIIAEELNIKELRYVSDLPKYLVTHDTVEGEIREVSWIELSKKLTPELKREGMMREVIRMVQTARKDAGLNVDDRIELELETADTMLARAIKEHDSTIMAETLAKKLTPVKNGYEMKTAIEHAALTIRLTKKR